MEEDPYTVLGVLPHAEDVVIKAAFRALAQRYHPDKLSGSVAPRTTTMAQLNAAYQTLSDPTARARYDQKKAALAGRRPYAPERDTHTDKAFSMALQVAEQRWAVACSVHPELQHRRSRLARLSTSLAFSYVTALLDRKAFANGEEFADMLEIEFLQRYFGTNPRIISFARVLVLTGQQEAARELNSLVDVLGASTDPELVIHRVRQAHAVRSWPPDADTAPSQTPHGLDAYGRFQADGSLTSAREWAAELGHKLVVRKRPWRWFGRTFIIRAPGGRAHTFADERQVIDWIRTNLLPTLDQASRPRAQ